MEYVYKYTNEVNDENKAVYINFLLSNGKLIQINIESLNF